TYFSRLAKPRFSGDSLMESLPVTTEELEYQPPQDETEDYQHSDHEDTEGETGSNPGTQGGKEFDVATTADAEEPKQEKQSERHAKASQGEQQPIQGADQQAAITEYPDWLFIDPQTDTADEVE